MAAMICNMTLSACLSSVHEKNAGCKSVFILSLSLNSFDRDVARLCWTTWLSSAFSFSATATWIGHAMKKYEDNWTSLHFLAPLLVP